VKLWGLNGGGRQENSLRTVRSISQVLYTNTGWSVRTCLGQAYILKQAAHTLGQVQIQVTGERPYCAPRSCDLFVDSLIVPMVFHMLINRLGTHLKRVRSGDHVATCDRVDDQSLGRSCDTFPGSCACISHDPKVVKMSRD